MNAPKPTRTVNCPECGGSGYRWGFDREIQCFDCGGEGQWEEEDQPTQVHSDPLLKHNRRLVA